MLNIIIVSHNHENYVKSLLEYLGFSQDIELQCRIIVKDNKKSETLKAICSQHGIIYCRSESVMGFGANNNYAVKYLRSNYTIANNDYFLFLNPDILYSNEQLKKLIYLLEKYKPEGCTVDLFKDEKLANRDLFVRKFPTAKDFVYSYILGKNETIIDRSNMNQPVSIDWCAGSFMVIRADVFLSLNGFDENYFMYCEDLDLCYRMKIAGYKLTYFPEVHAIHYAQHANRKIFSRPFYWHLKSVMRYVFKSKVYKDAKTYNKKITSILKNHE